MLFDLASALLVPALLSSLASAAVDPSTVGALTPLSSKTKICNVLDYGGVADNSTDIGPAITSAFSECAIDGGATIYIPPGQYSLATGVVLKKGSAYAIQIDGLITLTSDGDFGGNAFVIENTSDVEVFSSNALGAINGQGYIKRISDSTQNARLLRFISSSHISVHDLILVDSPTFHLIFNGISDLEAYHITIRGPSIGGTDGVDITCTNNCYLHDIEVTNRDECISVKTPSSNVLIEDVYCNQSGGMSIGSLTADDVTADTEAAVSNITMRNIYVYQCTQMLMIKTWPGGDGPTGYVSDSVFENFWAYDTTYGLDIDQYWYSHTTPDTGAVKLSGLTFNNWTGTVDNGVARGPITIRGSDIVPLTDITLTNFDMWTVNRDEVVNQCKNVYGSGYCVQTSTTSVLTTFTTSVTSTSPPAGFTSPTSPAWGVAGYGTTIPIPVYTPAVFWSPASSGVVSTTAHALVSTSAAPAKTEAVVATTAPSAQLSHKTSSPVATSAAVADISISSESPVVQVSTPSAVAVSASNKVFTSVASPSVSNVVVSAPASSATVIAPSTFITSAVRMSKAPTSSEPATSSSSTPEPPFAPFGDHTAPSSSQPDASMPSGTNYKDIVEWMQAYVQGLAARHYGLGH